MTDRLIVRREYILDLRQHNYGCFHSVVIGCHALIVERGVKHHKAKAEITNMSDVSFFVVKYIDNYYFFRLFQTFIAD
jgi:hypothetical protein